MRKNHYIVNADDYVMATTNGYTIDAIKMAKKHNISLLAEEDIVQMYNHKRLFAKADTLDEILKKYDLREYPNATIRTVNVIY